jgi:hypothetical protein
MIVQLPLTGKWGTEHEKAAYDRVQDAIAGGFDSHGFGYFDGNDYGSGTMNLFIYDIPAEQWDAALRLVLDTLKEHALLDRSIIARGAMSTDQESDQGDAAHEMVVWPVEFKGEFSLFNL